MLLVAVSCYSDAPSNRTGCVHCLIKRRFLQACGIDYVNCGHGELDWARIIV